MLEKGSGALNGAEEQTDKTWEGRRQTLQCHQAPCLVQRASQKCKRSTRVKERKEMMGLLGTIAFVVGCVWEFVSVWDTGIYVLVHWYICGAKRPPSFLSYSFRNKLCGKKRHHQIASGCGVDFVFTKTKGLSLLSVWPLA